MNYISDMEKSTQEDITELCSIWEQANMRVKDIKIYTITKNQLEMEHEITNQVFVYITSGLGYIQVKDVRYNVKKFSFFHTGNSDKISLKGIQSHLEYYYVEYITDSKTICNGIKRENIQEDNPLLRNFRGMVGNPLLLTELLKQMEKCFLSNSPIKSFRLKALFYQFLDRIIQDSMPDILFREEPDMVNMAINYMKQQYNVQITIQDLMDDLGISSTHLNRLFKQRTGKSPKEYLVMLRLNNAKIKLLETINSLREIAISSGYTDEYQFSRIFKKYVGIPPGQYRNLIGKRIFNDKNNFPVNPKRIAVQYLMGDVLALGLVPVGISEIYGGAVFGKSLKESTMLGHSDRWRREALAKVKPDLVIIINARDYDEFSKIAPTLYVPYERLSQEERIFLIGAVLNKRKEAESLLLEYQKKLERAKKKLRENGNDQFTFSNIEGGLNNMVVIGNKYGTGAIAYGPLGLKAPECVLTNIIDKDSYGKSVSFENLAEYSGDFIIRSAYEGMDDLSDSELWNSIPAIQKHHVREMDFGLNYYTDILSANAQIDYIVDFLTEKNSKMA